jgi:hypothetical protein
MEIEKRRSRRCARIPEIVVTHPLVPDDNLDLYWKFGRLVRSYHRRRGA